MPRVRTKNLTRIFFFFYAVTRVPLGMHCSNYVASAGLFGRCNSVKNKHAVQVYILYVALVLCSRIWRNFVRAFIKARQETDARRAFLRVQLSVCYAYASARDHERRAPRMSSSVRVSLRATGERFRGRFFISGWKESWNPRWVPHIEEE